MTPPDTVFDALLASLQKAADFNRADTAPPAAVLDHPLEPGSVVFIPGGTRHFVRNTGHETMRLLYMFAVDRFSDVEYVFPSTVATE